MARDYKAEYARRKARFAANPEKKKAYYQKQYQTDRERAKRRGYATVREAKRNPVNIRNTKRWREAQAFSDRFAITEKAMFRQDMPGRLGITDEEYLKLYEDAWYKYDDYKLKQRLHGSDALREWFHVNQFHDFSDNVYDERYR